ncbi:PspC domain-containing protein [Mucilaginibacter daejeonensis]|uniref:PspC domain-containing protein n=1 Tax=Mucilaginibacter daejeonensis TaxID=398049 RepID=UPI001D17BE15|nr:PspC domain-containing protein [Mucilaginibacter daejeonensis]UEG53039.1 PspC domain-containing protein [Mucilaginibacter daejeonensis]
MNKTIIININGTVFHIEEQAYELLKEYMTDVKRHFFNSADSLEITTDIENRIAEMFTEILERESRQAIIDLDVQAVIAQMGSVKDFESAEQEDQTRFEDPASPFTTGTRRLFRDPDDHLIGGVCAGIANYFDVQAIWIRFMFAAAFVFFGSGALVYIILWLIVPKAHNRAERMAMKGEPLDLQGFKRNFEAELNSVSGRLNEMTHDARPFIYKTRDLISDFFHHLGVFFRTSGKVIIKLLGIAVILMCVALIIMAIFALVSTWFFGGNQFSVPDSFFNYEYINQVRAAFLIIVVLPLTAIIVAISSAIFGTTGLNRSAGVTLLVIWISAVAILGVHTSRVLSEFRDSAGFTKTLKIQPNAKQVYYLELNETMYLTAEDSSRLDIKNKFRDMVLTQHDEEDMNPRNMQIDIERSDVPYPVLQEEFTSRGRNYESALSNARNTRYVFIQQDSVLKFDRKLRRLDPKGWHNEEVRLVLRIPLNATLMVNDRIARYITNYIDLYNCNPGGENRSENRYAPFVMTNEGLRCKLDSTTISSDNGVQVQDDQSTTIDTISATVPAPDTIYIDSVEAPSRKPVVIRRHRKR